MIEIEAQQTLKRIVVVSSEVLVQICPERGVSARLPLWFRIWTRLGVRAHLVKLRLQFVVGDLQPLRCTLVEWRLRARLAWMRIRHRRKLQPSRGDKV